MDKRFLVIEMTPGDYARLIGHSENYVRKYIMKNQESQKVQVRVRTEDILEDVYDVKGVDR